ncbi:MAG: tetratricopeptide repeat protein [Deltaproteobacteria bacterium]|nr:tetratricopeptide repeat protein [Deltaproteobacteria bacterium]
MHNQSYSEQQLLELFSQACQLHQYGEPAEAERLYRRLLELLPNMWQLYYNFGLLLYEQKRFHDAHELYQKAVSLTNPDNDLLYNLALCQKALGKYQQAIASYQKALAIDPEDIDSRYNLAGCYTALERYTEAINCYQDVLARQPHHKSSLTNQAYLFQKIGEIDAAIKGYKKLLFLNPQNLAADHMLAALTGEKRSFAPAAYVCDVFDSYSARYEESLVGNLQYNVPEKLRLLVDETSGQTSFTQVLDLGCGTGLCGSRFRSIACTMHGVDLSANMLAIAREKNIYDLIFEADIVSYLMSSDAKVYDLILAADVLTYVGDLNTLFTLVNRAARAEAFFYFSVEKLFTDSEGMILRKSGRFAHSASYVSSIAKKTNWRIVAAEEVNLRKERDDWIRGTLFAMTKKQAT